MSSRCMGPWFQAIALDVEEEPKSAARDDDPSVKENTDLDATELSRPTALGKIIWYLDGQRPQDLRVCPSHLIAKSDKVRMAND